MTRIGALFAGAGMLETAVQAVTGGQVAWHSENDPAASKLLAHRFLGVPNHGDITRIDWSQVEPVEVLTGGFPCQDVSLAGGRAGMHQHTRSGLWAEYARAIDTLQPGLVVIENVRGLLSAEAASDMEPCPWCVGDEPGEPVLRALGAVLGDLAGLGYDAEWCGLRAADVGAPHGRFRIFITATNTERGGRARWASDTRRGQVGGTATERAGADAAAYPGHGRDAERAWSPWRLTGEWAPVGAGLGRDNGAAADTDGQAGRRVESRRITPGSPARTVLETGRGTGRDSSSLTADTDGDALRLEPVTQRRGSGQAIAGRSGATPTDTEHCRRERRACEPERRSGGGVAAAGSGAINWGNYEAAIHRWERLTRSAPPPTTPGPKGGQRLNPDFTDWMMGWPDHWTDIPGLTRNDRLRICGNGVVPQQATTAFQWLLGAERAA